MSGLSVRGVRASFGRQDVLDGLDLAIPEHSLVSVLGPSGCGKSTLLRVLAGFHRPTAGTIVLGSTRLDAPPTVRVPAERRRIGLIPQEIALFPHLSVAANVAFGLPRSRRRTRVAELLELVDLADLAARRPSELSGGQQQRVALARALAPEPELLLLDEPFSALDAALRSRVRSEVADLLRATGTTAILVTHDADEALGFADLVAVLDRGQVAQIGSPADLYERPVSVSVARATGDLTVVPAQVSGGSASTALGALGAGNVPNGAALVLVRPGQLRPADDSGVGSFHGQVLRASYRGDRSRVEVAVSGLMTPLLVDLPGPVEPGVVVHLRVDGPVLFLDC